MYKRNPYTSTLNRKQLDDEDENTLKVRKNSDSGVRNLPDKSVGQESKPKNLPDYSKKPATIQKLPLIIPTDTGDAFGIDAESKERLSDSKNRLVRQINGEEGSRIKNSVQKALSRKYGTLDTLHIFDDIDDDIVERNIDVAKSAINTNIERGTLSKDYKTKYPNMLDGMTMFYAAGEKGNSKAMSKSKEVAYSENTKKQPSVLSTNLQNVNLQKSTNSMESNFENVNNPSIQKTSMTMYSSTSKPQDNDDIYLPENAKKELSGYKDEYNKAKANNDYLGMNEAHKKAAELRNKYYTYEDTYDYTYGGKYDIYTNYDSSYDPDGHYENVFKFSAEEFSNFLSIAHNSFNEKDNSNSETGRVLNGILNVFKGILDKVFPYGSKMMDVGASFFNNLSEEEKKAFGKAYQSYSELHNNYYANEGVDFYIYVLDGGYSTEIKVRVIDKETGKTIEENQFDTQQYNAYNAFYNSAEAAGEMVSENRRPWTYTYVHN